MKYNFKIIKNCISNKNEYGIGLLNNKKVFYKKGNYSKQLINYKHLLLTSFISSEIILIDKINNYVFYNYDNDLYNNTLYDTLYFNNVYWQYRNTFFNIIRKDINDGFIYYFNSTNSKTFFTNRKEWILDSIPYSNNKHILYNIYDFLSNIDRNKYRVYFSNGDLTDTNICLNNKICDTECAGLNVVIADLSIFFVSIIYGNYIYPKYHKNAYIFRKNIIYNPILSINDKQFVILNKIIKLVKINEFNDFKKLIIMRLITPFTLKEIDKSDVKVIDSLINIIYNSSFNNILSNLKKDL